MFLGVYRSFQDEMFTSLHELNYVFSFENKFPLYPFYE